MRPELSAFKRELVNHYAEMALLSDDWREQARASCADLSARFPEQFKDLGSMVKQAMLERKSSE